MAGYTGKHSNSPRRGIEAIAEAEREDSWGNMRGIVESYDAAAGTIKVKPLITKTDGDGEPLDAPILEDVPLDFMTSGQGGITFPVPKGTEVILSPSMRSQDDDEEAGAPVRGRANNLSDMRATLVGGNRAGTGVKNVDAENTHIRADPDGKFGHRMSQGGQHAIEGATGELLDLIAQIAETLSGEVAVVSSGSSAGSWAIQNQGTYAGIAAKVRGMKL